jgi:hypothetical protein
MKTLALTADEFSWLRRNVERLATALTEKTKTRELTMKLAYRLISDTFQMDSKQRINVPVNRTELRIMQQLVSNQHKILVENVIPNYKEEPEKFKKYIEAAEAKASLLTEILEKVEAAL